MIKYKICSENRSEALVNQKAFSVALIALCIFPIYNGSYVKKKTYFK